MKTIKIYTDGSCDINKRGIQNKGGWSAIIQFEKLEKEFSGQEKNTTNNRMELIACIKALEMLNYSIAKDCQIEVYSDSSYLVNSFEKRWIQGWFKKKKKIINLDLWKILYSFYLKYKIKFIHVKGHSGIVLNERVDQLANQQLYL